MGASEKYVLAFHKRWNIVVEVFHIYTSFHDFWYTAYFGEVTEASKGIVKFTFDTRNTSNDIGWEEMG